MKRIKQLMMAVGFTAVALLPGVVGAQVVLAQGAAAGESANIQSSTCAGAELDATKIGTAECSETNATAASGVTEIVALIINIFSWVVGVVAVIAIIIGGFKYITSGGDASGVTGAKNTILYAIVGLVIVALAQLIVKFVLGNVTAQPNIS